VNIVRRCVDLFLVILIIAVMTYEITGDLWHEWTGIVATALVIFHMVLNRKWFGAFFKGRYNVLRIVLTLTDTLMIVFFLLCALCGMCMSVHATPFLYGKLPMMFAMKTHLAASYWTFILTGIHLGLHMPAIMSGFGINGTKKTLLTIVLFLIGLYGLFLFVTQGKYEYLTFRQHFAMLDYETPKLLMILNNFSIFAAFMSIGMLMTKLKNK
jgi:hypothetical protein